MFKWIVYNRRPQTRPSPLKEMGSGCCINMIIFRCYYSSPTSTYLIVHEGRSMLIDRTQPSKESMEIRQAAATTCMCWSIAVSAALSWIIHATGSRSVDREMATRRRRKTEKSIVTLSTVGGYLFIYAVNWRGINTSYVGERSCWDCEKTELVCDCVCISSDILEACFAMQASFPHGRFVVSVSRHIVRLITVRTSFLLELSWHLSASLRLLKALAQRNV